MGLYGSLGNGRRRDRVHQSLPASCPSRSHIVSLIGTGHVVPEFVKWIRYGVVEMSLIPFVNAT